MYASTSERRAEVVLIVYLPLASLNKFTLPPVKGFDGADDLNGSGQARASDTASQSFGGIFAVYCSHYLYEVSHEPKLSRHRL